MRIGFVIWSLCQVKGGIERLGTTLSSAMSARGHECVIFCQNPGGRTPPPLYPVAPGTPVVELGLSDAASLGRARAAVGRCRLDVMCALFSWDALLWMPALLNNSGVPLLVSEHNHPGIIEAERWNAYERRACLAGADAIHILTEAFLPMLPEFLRQRATVIPNPARPAAAVDWSRENAPRKRLLGVGRMVEESKQFSLLISAFATLAPAFADWDLWLCGDGENLAQYRQLACDVGLKDRIVFTGRVDDVDSYYAASHLFCIPSRYEGFGLVTVEAQRHALPAVGFAGCTATNELIIHGENGLLASDMTAQSLAESLRPLMSRAPLRRAMGLRGQELLARYDWNTVMDRWEALLAHTASHKGQTRLCYAQMDESAASEQALAEILARQHPFARPAQTQLERSLHQQGAMLARAVELLRHNGIITS